MYAKRILQTLIELERSIKNTSISTWCDHIPEWQKFITSLLQYLCSIENNIYNSIDSINYKYLEDSLQYYDKIKIHFNTNELQEQLLILRELIEYEIQYNKYQFNCMHYNKHYQYNKLFYTYQNRSKFNIFTNMEDVRKNIKIDLVLFKYKCDLRTMFFKQKINNFLQLDLLYKILPKRDLKNNI